MSSTTTVSPSTYEKTPVLRGEVDEVVGEVDHTFFARQTRERPVLHLRHRQEGRPAGRPRFQVLDTRLPDAVVVDHDVGESAAGGRLTGGGVVGVDPAQLPDGAVDALAAGVEDGRHRTPIGGVTVLSGLRFEFGVLLLFGADFVL